MNESSPLSAVSDNSYIAWSLYTGPAHVVPLWPSSRWIAGEWTGYNTELVKDQIQNDINARVACLMQAFLAARKQLSEAQRTFAVNFMVVPEFFFHCKQGPYPNLSFDGLEPFEYIQATLERALKTVDLLNGEVWILATGSILTCNEADYARVINSPDAIGRLAAINNELAKMTAANGIASAADFLSAGPYIKGLSYAANTQNLPDPQKAIDGLMNRFRADPLCIVRNRGLLFEYYGSTLDTYKYEKQSESTVDLTMGKLIWKDKVCQLVPDGMIAEWMAGYPSIGILDGDKQPDAATLPARLTLKDPHSTAKTLELGVEICLDHRLARLRRTVGMTLANGAKADNPALAVQLVPSGGMQILDGSVAADGGGAIFNGDGCDPILDVYTDKGKPIIPGSGTFKQITCGVYASSAQTLVKPEAPYSCFSHSQLSFRYGNKAMDGYNNALGTANTKGATYDAATMKNPTLDAYPTPRVVPVPISAPAPLFAAGFGELHVYAKPR